MKKIVSYILIFAIAMTLIPYGVDDKNVMREVYADSSGKLDGILDSNSKKMYDSLENIDGYKRPSAAKILSDYRSGSQNKKHPRVMITSKRIDELKGKVSNKSSSEYFWYNKIKTRADIICTSLKGSSKGDFIPVYSKQYESRMKQKKSNGSTVNTADLFRYEIMVLGMMYQLTEDTKYSEAAWTILETTTKFADINPWHDLDFGFFCHGYAIGYDWMYSAWNDSQKEILRNAILNHCFSVANRAYTNNKISRSQTGANASIRGVYVDNNHNAIVNSGIAMASFSFMDDYPEISSSLCRDAFICLERVLNTYAPSGLNNEGTQYWLLTMDDLSMLFSTLESTTGNLYGLDTCKGLSDGKTMRALHAIESDVGMFSFGDTFDSLLTSAGELYFDKHYNLSGFRKAIHDRIKKTDDYARIVQVLCWYEPDNGSQEKCIDRDWQVDGKGAYATFRNNFDEGQSFVGIKAGQTLKEFFMHLDEGSFVFHSQGVKWAIDLGSDNYDIDGYSDIGNKRWNIFRLRPDAHNTLLIDPNPSDAGYEFNKTAYLNMESSEKQVKAVIDMSELVSNKASSYKRGFLFTDDRTSLVVRDEVSLKGKSDLYWIMYTEQTVSIEGNTATLTEKGGKKLKVDFVSSKNGKLYTMSAAPWNLAPEVKSDIPQNPNSNYTRLVYQIDDVESDVSITAKLTPVIDATKSAPDVSEYGEISKWSIGKQSTESSTDKNDESTENSTEKNIDKSTEGTNSKQNQTSSKSDSDKDYQQADKIPEEKVKPNALVSDKKTGGKYKITKVIRKKGKITGGYAMYMAPNNRNCTKATIPNAVVIGGVKFKVTAVSKDAFKNCKKLKSVCIGTNVNKIGDNAFRGCSKLKSVIIRSKKINKIGTKAFYGINKKAKFRVPKAKLKKYTKLITKAKAPKKSKITK